LFVIFYFEFIDYRKPELADTKGLSQAVADVTSSFGIEDDETADTLNSIKTAERVSGTTLKTPVNNDKLLTASGFEDDGRITAQMLSQGMIDPESENRIAKKQEYELA
jgi:hypothetical protein